MSKIVDARGLSCPQPVLMTLDAIKSGSDGELEVIVDNMASRENVVRAAESKGWNVFDIKDNDDKTQIFYPERMILVFKRISRLFSRTPKDGARKTKEDLGIMVFENTSEVIQAENFLKSRGWEIKVMGPPPGIQSGCDLVIQFPLIERLMLARQLEEAGLPPLEVVPVTHPLLKPVDLFSYQGFW